MGASSLHIPTRMFLFTPQCVMVQVGTATGRWGGSPQGSRLLPGQAGMCIQEGIHLPNQAVLAGTPTGQPPGLTGNLVSSLYHLDAVLPAAVAALLLLCSAAGTQVAAGILTTFRTSAPPHAQFDTQVKYASMLVPWCLCVTSFLPLLGLLQSLVHISPGFGICSTAQK